MNRNRSHSRRRTQLRTDWLEARLVLSADSLSPFLSIAATSPSDGSALARTPDRLSLTFDRPVDPESLFFNDLQLDLVGSDDSLTPLFDPDLGVDEQLDDTRTVLTVPVNFPLAPGHYRIVLSGMAMLSGLDGAGLAGDGSDTPLADFTVTTPGISTADADDLGLLPGDSASTVSGTLDLDSDPSAVALYKVQVPAGHFWRLGAEVSARRNGSPLDAALTLFDSQGRPLSTADLGRADVPADPFLFAGLAPGTYYVGVSGSGNLPGAPGGYDLVSARPGASTSPGGDYTLRLALDTADGSTQLLRFGVDRADPLDPEPTGLTLQFSGPLGIDPSTMGKSAGLRVVDASGKSWPVAAIRYDDASARLSLLFLDPLPAGIYSVRLASESPLTDLAGKVPVSPGFSTGVLATFYADGAGTHADPNDLGSIFPNAASDGVSRGVDLASGQSVTYRFVNLYRGDDTLSATAVGGPVRVELIDVQTGAVRDLDTAQPGQPATNPISLEAGHVYQIRFTAVGAAATRLDWTLRLPSLSGDSLLGNGVGQGPALSLRLVAPGASDPAGSSSSGGSVLPPAASGSSTAPSPQANSVASSPGGSTASTSPTAGTGESASASPTGSVATAHAGSPAGLFLGIGGQTVGRSSLPLLSTGTSGGATVAHASTGEAPGQAANHGLNAWLTENRAGDDGALTPNPPSTDDEALASNPPGTDGAMLANVPASPLPSEVPAASVPELPQVAWVDRLRRVLGVDAPNGPSFPFDPNAVVPDEQLAAADPGLSGDPSEPPVEVEQAGLPAPIAAGLIAVVVARSQQSVRRWFRRRRGLVSPVEATPSRAR